MPKYDHYAALFYSFGFITNTGVRMVLVLEVNNLELKDLDIRSIFKHFHTLYCNAISNPFYCLGDEISSKTVVEAGLRILNDNFEI
ncbi:hypothetical protein DICVIV_11350 [Dictyocaulus viviparus]|uniref:Sedlin, region n=1 Tax=Dictyocaulus viviparus TaxID=29172 RepID=A0A0D8XDF4_DICVI|nr:hypothetical protein DICVIV_11350 [Dictyocaulus viviparus]